MRSLTLGKDTEPFDVNEEIRKESLKEYAIQDFSYSFNQNRDRDSETDNSSSGPEDEPLANRQNKVMYKEKLNCKNYTTSELQKEMLTRMNEEKMMPSRVPSDTNTNEKGGQNCMGMTPSENTSNDHYSGSE